MTPIKTRLADAADALAGDLESLSHRIHAHPELGFKEVQASGWLADFLAAQGFKVERRSRPARARPSPSCASTTRCPASGMRAGTTSSRRRAPERARPSPR
jgi:metal-dependent amidase/aminoacylase/carboxypeptidase family protein